MSNPTTHVFSDSFARPGTNSVAAGGNPWSSTQVGNGWIDRAGSTYWVPYANTLQLNGALGNYTNGGHLVQDQLLTPTPNARIVGTTGAITYPASSTSAYAVVLRVQPNGDCYYAQLSNASGGGMAIFKIIAGAPTLIASVAAVPTTGDVYTLDLTATGDGSSTTTLTFTVTNVTTSTQLATCTGTDTTAELQSGGMAGLSNGSSPLTLSYTKADIYSDTPYLAKNVVVGFIGDSIMAGAHTTQGPTADVLIRMLNAKQTAKRYVGYNQGISGLATSNWLPGFGYLNNAVANFNDTGVSIVVICLGTNDAFESVSAATWFANMQSIINYIAGQISGVQIIVEMPPWLDYVRVGSGSSATVPLLQSYVAAAYSLTGCTLGDTTAISSFPNLAFTSLYDGVHPNDLGASELAQLWLPAFFPAAASKSTEIRYGNQS